MSNSNPTDQVENTNEISLADQTDSKRRDPKTLFSLFIILLCLIALLILGIFLLRSSLKLFQGDTQPTILKTSSPLEVNY